MFSTRNDLPLETRKNITELVQGRLADSIDLSLQCKQAHWNVRGPHFSTLHELFDRVHEEIEKSSDVLAERIVQLGGIADGTLDSLSKGTSLSKYPLTLTKDFEHLNALCDSVSCFAKNTRQTISNAESFGDAVTADILVEITRRMDKTLWMLEKHLLENKTEAKTPVKGVA